MKFTIRTVSSLALLFVLAACGKQPTEMQKAQIEKKLLDCLISVTTQVGAKQTDMFSGLSSLSSKVGSASDMSKLQWMIISGAPETVNMSFTASDTKYSCDYVQKADSPEYQLVEVSRNKEVVFNLIDDEKARAENERLVEEKRLEKERQKELERVEKIKKWTERSYSNAAYKYYEKRHIADTDSNYGSPKLKIECNPKGMQFELDRVYEIRNHPFIFLIDGEKIEKKYDLTSEGAIGTYNVDNWRKISRDQNKQDEFMRLFTKSEALFVDGYEYHIDNLSQIPCMK